MDNMKLIVAIINYLKEECSKPNLNPDTKESLEVAIQCLQTAYDLRPDDLLLPHLQIPRSLAHIFRDAVSNNVPPCASYYSPESANIEAEKMKTLGNDLMKSECYKEALEAYTKAIELDSGNAVYYCNRAAAHSRLNNYEAAIKDCEHAISLDKNYSKAYGRMGLAYGSLNQHEKAVECYKKAVELDPTNESYRSNLKIAEEKITGGGSNTASGSSSNPVDLTALLNNPMLRNMATTMMQDPSMINLMSGFMSTSLAENSEGSRSSMDALLQAGQRLAAEMQAANPTLVEQLRQQFLSGNQNSQNDSNKDSSA